MKNSKFNRRQSWITAYRVVSTVLLVVIIGVLLFRPEPTMPAVPTAMEIAKVVNGSVEFQRPSAMEYVAKTNSCVVGGTVTASEWHVGRETHDVASVDSTSVDFTSLRFKSDEGREFTVSQNGALFTSPGANLGLELFCDPATMKSDPSFGLIAIIYGGM